MQTISPSEVLRQKRLQIITNTVRVQESTTGLTPRYGVALPIKISAINSTKFLQTPTQKNFTTGKTISPTTHVKF